MKSPILVRAALLASLAGCHAGPTSVASDAVTRGVRTDARGFVVDGRYRLLRGGSLQWFRIPEEEWDDRLSRFAAAGFNTVDVYVAWNQHERVEGVFDFETPDLRKFLTKVQQHGLYVYLRPGPYITNEMDGGGVPSWVFARTTKKSRGADGLMNLRTNDPEYLAAVRRWYAALDEVVRPYQASKGGPIVLYAVENEYNWFETFFQLDKLFWYDGGPERGLTQSTDTPGYFAALRDMVRADGIEVPITTCPGAGSVSGTGNVPGIVPMPNIYKPEHVEKTAYDIVTSMHDPSQLGGVYVDMPSGASETDRTAARLRRLIFGGLDAVFAFNVVGMHQEGNLNAVVLDNAGPRSIFDVSTDALLGAFVSPTVGYFPGVIDYYGAIGPSGTLRRKFWSYRRTNLFFDAFEDRIAPIELPRRSGRGLAGGDPRVAIDHPALGADEGKGRVHSWLDAGHGNYFIELVNESGDTQTVSPGQITVDELHIPKYTQMTVAGEDYAGPTSDSGERQYAHVLVTGLPLVDGARLRYTTSEILTARDFNGDELLVLYGPDGSAGELALDQLRGRAQVLRGDGFKIELGADDRLELSYRHRPHQLCVVRTAEGRTLRIVVTTRDEAGKSWFVRVGGSDVMLAGLDYLAGTTSDGDGLQLSWESAATPSTVFTLSPRALALAGFAAVDDFDPLTGAQRFVGGDTTLLPTPGALPAGRTTVDLADAQPTAPTLADDRIIDGDPQPLEQLGITGGHVWYRAELDLADPNANDGHLWVEHASDFVGIYVNGTYVTTVAPLGTEIDSSGRARYAFPSLAPLLVKGRNVIAFRVEVWGHGSFMWPRGILAASKAQLPSLGFDAVKGLWGAARLGNQPLTRWTVRRGLGGERGRFWDVALDDGAWTAAQPPFALGRGEVRWYRTRLPSSLLPDPTRFDAPVVLRLRGENAKATIWLDGRLIGRWLSDDGWLARGAWNRATRAMWVNTSTDDFPVSPSLVGDGEDHVLTIAFEDASAAGGAPGHIDEVSLAPAAEERAGDSSVMVATPLRRLRARVSPR